MTSITFNLIGTLNSGLNTEFRIGEHRIPVSQTRFYHARRAVCEPAGQPHQRAYDFMHKEVRDYKLAIMKSGNTYDVEGIGWISRLLFQTGPGEGGRRKMTEFIASVRKGLDRIGKRRTAASLVSEVPPTMSACLRLIRRASMDNRQIRGRGNCYARMASDFGMPVEEFIEAAKGTNCKVIMSIGRRKCPCLRTRWPRQSTIRRCRLLAGRVDGMQMFNMHLLRTISNKR